MLLYTFTAFHTLGKALQAFISFPTLSYTLFYAFICFHMLFIHFHTLSYAFYMLSYTFKRKEAKRPLPSLNVPRTQGIVRLSRCAAGKNPLSANSFQPLVIFTALFLLRGDLSARPDENWNSIFICMHALHNRVHCGSSTHDSLYHYIISRLKMGFTFTNITVLALNFKRLKNLRT